jgi:hypothetical protein
VENREPGFVGAVLVFVDGEQSSVDVRFVCATRKEVCAVEIAGCPAEGTAPPWSLWVQLIHRLDAWYASRYGVLVRLIGKVPNQLERFIGLKAVVARDVEIAALFVQIPVVVVVGPAMQRSCAP